MVRTTVSFIALSLFAVQAAIAQSLESGVYKIYDSYRENSFAIGPVPIVYPPLDVPLRLLPAGSPMVNRWHVTRTSGDRYTIIEGDGRSDNYKIIPMGDNVFVSATGPPREWSITEAGDGQFVIQIPNQDSIVTAHEGEDVFPPLALEPANGSPNQKWKFVRIDFDDSYHWGSYHRKGSHNRLCAQE
ncbi:hypothetical protein BGX21_001514 [Mortierella sp. AD011]|nr:hypothetical protein BGX20_001210 [Mortierella sp. AD010]KAF9383678.1 hypothetical protein BGX21_001514 [Mortierella sp. AD011]